MWRREGEGVCTCDLTDPSTERHLVLGLAAAGGHSSRQWSGSTTPSQGVSSLLITPPGRALSEGVDDTTPHRSLFRHSALPPPTYFHSTGSVQSLAALLKIQYRLFTVKGRGGQAGSLLASHQAEPGSIPIGSLPDFHKWESFRKMALVGEFSRGSPVSPRPCIPTLLHSRLIAPSSPLNISLLRDSKTSQLNSTQVRRVQAKTARLARTGDGALSAGANVTSIAPTLLGFQLPRQLQGRRKRFGPPQPPKVSPCVRLPSYKAVGGNLNDYVPAICCRHQPSPQGITHCSRQNSVDRKLFGGAPECTDVKVLRRMDGNFVVSLEVFEVLEMFAVFSPLRLDYRALKNTEVKQ
ncbi:hypothetical protein PR048_028865 [Dryococelus australis]|uniref:Uncharacterized protein n=1 Tax=Dryococelus australis TaxID=614101 RepID=A0ABQ9GBS7_9NEOP|nr:hypothetical protein PR048_028865 [Dryococelus australis]